MRQLEEERSFRVALKLEASQINLPSDLLERILREEPRVRPAHPTLWSRLGPKLEALAACVVLAGLAGIGIMRNAHHDPATPADISTPHAVKRVVAADAEDSATEAVIVLTGDAEDEAIEVVTAFLEAARRGDLERARSYWTGQTNYGTVDALIGKYYASRGRVHVRVRPPEYRDGSASVAITISVDADVPPSEGDTRWPARWTNPSGDSVFSLQSVDGDWKILSWIAR